MFSFCFIAWILSQFSPTLFYFTFELFLNHWWVPTTLIKEPRIEKIEEFLYFLCVLNFFSLRDYRRKTVTTLMKISHYTEDTTMDRRCLIIFRHPQPAAGMRNWKMCFPCIQGMENITEPLINYSLFITHTLMWCYHNLPISIQFTCSLMLSLQWNTKVYYIWWT